MKIKIFYSWQSTTDTKYNRNFIATCIEKATKKLKRKEQFKNVDFEILDGVRNEPGSPSVASKITDERIPNCDIFIADLSVINKISPIQKFVRKIIGDKFKPFQNNNVINEHGVALNALGKERIIGILNTEFGSPKDNPENIPFDLRHLSFPIEYNYSENTTDRDKALNALVNNLSSALRGTVLYAIKCQKDRYKPLLAWSDWEAQTNISQKFYGNEIIKDISRQISNGIKNTDESLRILGLSGLGKTRILLELFRPTDDESVLLSGRILYINCNVFPTLDYQTLFSKVTSEEKDKIIILDNCSRNLHRQLLHFVKTGNNTVSLISIDSNPEEIEQDKINGVNYIVIKKDDFSDIVDKILEDNSAILGKENVEKIKEFSQGIPLMAVLIGESIKAGEKFVGKLEDKELLDKLLGEKGNNTRFRTILKSCAIFNYFGFEDDLKAQLRFIATNKNITSLDGDEQVLINDFYEICGHYLKREIFEKKGRFIGMRPFPLAMSLTEEWLDSCEPERLLNIITEIAQLEEPHRKNLSEAIAEQMKYLGYEKKAVLIIEKIVGPNSPFDNAEVLNTELGSRLFRSFVEVNPIAVCENLVRVFSSNTKEELLKIEAGRRNLVWVLEKLCFDNRTFSEGAKILFSFAVAENETWSNNATGQFLHLFKIILAGTEANLEQRWKIIEWGITLNNEDYFELAIKAMTSALDYGHFSRTGGSEKQGSRTLKDHHPRGEEVNIYWTNILKTLTDIVIKDEKYSRLASDAISNKIRTLCRARFTSKLLPFVEQIISYKNNDWDEGLKGLKHARKYERGILKNEELNKINELIKLLTKTDFQTRFDNISSSYYLDGDESYSSEKLKEAIAQLADEFITMDLSWTTYFPGFYSGQHVYMYYFGKRVYELIGKNIDKRNLFIEQSLKVITTTQKENRDVSILLGFILEGTKDTKKNFFETLFNDDELNYLLFLFVSRDKDGREYYTELFNLVKTDKCNLTEFSIFSHSISLEQCSLKEIKEFAQTLFTFGDVGYSLVFDILYNLTFNNAELKDSLKEIYKDCIFRIGIDKKTIRSLDSFRWAETISNILLSPEETELALFINRSIIESISWDNSYHLDHDIQKIYSVLLKNHFHIIWQDLSDALLAGNDDYVKFYSLKHIIGSHIGDVIRPVGVLMEGDLESIFRWCEEKSPKAPARFAELVPVYGGNNNNFSEWHPVAKRLIDNFGNIEDVLSNLSSNMGTYSWVGSVVPMLEAKKVLFEALTDHNITEVSAWAKHYLSHADVRIKEERNRDEEMYL